MPSVHKADGKKEGRFFLFIIYSLATLEAFFVVVVDL